ncbi:MAG TPA: hypothetical protein VH854_00665 [Thermoanaerobaculia bacterium]|nr:hypothetical protein [Thermoanaerobaculia bacterium]
MKRISNRDLASGVFRAWAIFWAVYALFSLVSVVGALVHDPYPSQPGMRGLYVSGQAISLACEILIFVLLMRRADWLARVVFPLETELGTSIGAAELRSVLFAAIGLYFLIAGARGCVGWLFRFVANLRHGDASVSRMPSDPERIVADVAEMIFGATALLWRSRSREALSSVRGAYDRTLGLGEPPDETPPLE